MLEDPTSGGGAPADDLDLELQDAGHKPAQKQVTVTPDAIPEKYQGKSVEDLIKMHQHAEQALSRQGNELATVRGLADQLIAVKPVSDNTRTAKSERKPVTVDDLLTNPETAITQAIESSPLAEQAKAATQEAAQLRQQLAFNNFQQKYPEFQKDIQNPAFTAWVQTSSARTKLVQRAEKAKDFEAAVDLWDMWTEHQQLVGAKTVERANEAATKASTVKTGAAQPSKGEPVYSRSKLMELRMRAEDGDQAAQAKLNDPEFNARLVKAYADGRVR